MNSSAAPLAPGRPIGRPAVGERSPLRAVALPSEHGGWSLTLEPVVLALIVAFSWSGLALGAAAFLAFLARTPLKVVLVDRWRGRWLERTSLAFRVAAVESAVMAALVAVTVVGAARPFWVPLLVGAPLMAIQLWFDMRSRSRRLLPELSGTIGISSIATAIGLAGGLDTALAIGLWIVVAARGVAAIPYARTQVFRLHGRPVQRWVSDLAQVVGVVGATIGWLVHAVPFASVVAIVVLAVINIVAVRTEPKPAKVIGIQQMLFGFAVIAVTATAIHLR